MKTKLNAATMTGLAAMTAIGAGCDLTPAAPHREPELRSPGFAVAPPAGCVAFGPDVELDCPYVVGDEVSITVIEKNQ